MQRWKAVVYNICFALNCLLLFLVIFESRFIVPAWLQVAGRMHPLMVHFPIVLMVLSIFSELFPGKKPHDPRNNIGDGLLLLTSVSAAITAIMGLLLSKESGYTPDVLLWHKWSGIFISFLSFAWYGFRSAVRKKRIVSTVTALASLAVIVVTGHLGADITHGEDFIYAPILAEQQPAPVLFEEAAVYTHMVQPIFKAKCEGCHNEKKAKGQLNMESMDLLLKGGKTGPLWDSTEKDYGLLLRRIHLPMQSKKHMPPAGKTQLTDEEMAILSQWIMKGANFTSRVAELPPTDSLRILAATMFNTIESDDYTFSPADDKIVQKLHNNYRTVLPVSLGSPALKVEFFGAAQYKPEQLKDLLQVKDQIISLNLNKIPVTDNDLQTIAQFTNLRKLNLSFTNIKGSNLQVLQSLKELKQLSLSGTAVSAAAVKPLAPLPNLTQLYLWSTPAQNEDLSSIKKLFKNTNLETGFKGDTIRIKLNAPLIENENEVVIDPLPLKLKHYVKNVSIHFTTDGSEPDSLKSPLYKGDFAIDKNMTIKAKAFKQGWGSSDIVEKTFFKAGFKIDSVALLKAPDPKYKGTGATLLIDAAKGDFNYGNGKWLGYREHPLEAMLYLDEPRPVSSITISSLVHVDAYLMPAQEIIVLGGTDPGKLHLLKRLQPDQPSKILPAVIKGFELSFKTETVQYIKVMMVPVQKLPKWHRGKGEKGWIFVDEILLN